MTLNHENRLRASALTLSFGELWQRVALELDKSGARPPARRLSFEYFLRLSEDVTALVLGFLDPVSLSYVGATCRALHEFTLDPCMEDCLWERHCLALFPAMQLHVPGVQMRKQYLELELMRYEAELRHLRSQQSLLQALCQMPKGSVVGVVSNMGAFDDAAVALAVSVQRQVAMSAVLLSRSVDAVTFRRCTDFVGPVTFFSQDNMSLVLADPSFAMPEVVAEGFVGYAVNLLRLEPQDEYMRYTCVLCALRNLTVWRSKEAMRAARASGALPPNVGSVSLDCYTREALSLWFRTGKVLGASSRRYPSYVAFGRPRPRLAEAPQLREYLRVLEARRDGLQDALALIHHHHL